MSSKSKHIFAAIICSVFATSSVIPVSAANEQYVIEAGGTGTSNVTFVVSDDPNGGGNGGNEGEGGGNEGGGDPDVIIATVPVELPIAMSLDGTITTPTNASIINHVADKGIAVTDITVTLDTSWQAANWSDDFTAKAEDANELALSLRGDTLDAAGDFTQTPENWKIAGGGTLPLNMEAKIPKHTEAAKSNIAQIGFTIDWSGDNSGSGGDTPVDPDNPDNPTPPEATILNVDWDNGLMLPGSTNTAVFKWKSPENNDLVSIVSDNPDVANVSNISTMALVDGEEPVAVEAKALGTATVTGTLSTGETASFTVNVSELDNSKEPSGEVTPDNNFAEGDTLQPGDVTVTIPVTKPDGSTEDVVVTPDVLPDTPLKPGDNEFDVTVDVNGTTITIKIHITVEIKNASNGLVQSVVDAQAMGFSFAAYEDGLAITDFENKQFKSEINVPEQIGDFKVLKIADNAFDGQTNIKKVTLPSSVTEIGASAFNGCTTLSDVTLSSELKSIGNNAFKSCTKLQGVQLPGKLQTIGATAFDGCTSLDTVNLPDSLTSIGTQAFKNVTSVKVGKAAGLSVPSTGIFTDLQAVTFSGTEKAVGDNFFIGTPNIGQIVVPDTVESLGAKSLGSIKEVSVGKVIESAPTNAISTQVAKVIVRDGVTTIPESAFEGRKQLTQVILPDTIESLEKNAFKGCTALTSINAPSALTAVKSGAFYNCSALTQFELPASVSTIGVNSFSGTKLTAVTIPNGVTVVEDGAFKNCSALVTVTGGNGLTKLANNAFYGCSTLSNFNGTNTIVLPNGLMEIGDNAFNGCSSAIASITLPETVEKLGTGCLMGLTGIKTLSIPNSVKSIGGKIKESVDTLKIGKIIESDVTAPYVVINSTIEFIDDSIIRIGTNQALGFGGNTVKLPSGLTSIGTSAFKDSKLTTLSVPAGVTNIEANAFSNCPIVSVELPNALTTLGSNAFYKTNISKVVLPDTLATIGTYAFGNCTSLTNVTIGRNVETVSNYAFNECPITQLSFASDCKLKTIGNYAFNKLSVSSLILPNKVASIGERAFQSQTGSMTIPDSVTYIGELAIYRVSNLTIGKAITCLAPTSTVNTNYKPPMTFYKSPFDTWDSLQLSSNMLPNITFLKTLTITSTATTVPQNTFKYFNGLTTINIKKSSNSISGAPWGAPKATIRWNQ